MLVASLLIENARVRETERFINDVEKRFVPKVSSEVFAEKLRRVIRSKRRLGPDMRGDQYVVKSPKWTTLWQRLHGRDIETGTGEMSRCQAVAQVRFMDACPPGNIDKVGALGHGEKHSLVHTSAGRFIQRQR
jgi:hypothetical protein